MKKANKLLSFVMAVIMLFSVMSVGMVSLAATVTVGSNTGSDTYEETDNVVICVPETVYMTPSSGASTTGQYYVNNVVSSSGVVSLDSSSSATSGKFSIYAPGAVSFSVAVNSVSGGIGDTVVSGSFNENASVSMSGGYYSATALAINISGAGLTAGNTALAEWEITLTYTDGTAVKYYAYTTLYAPTYTLGASAEARESSDTWNDVSAWISGITGLSAASSPIGKTSVDGSTAYGIYNPDPLWNLSVLPSGGSQNATDVITENGTKYVTSASTDGQGTNHVQSRLGLIYVDLSRYTNINQIPNFKVGTDVTATGSYVYNVWPYYGALYEWYSYYMVGDDTAYTTDPDDESHPSTSNGWTELTYVDRKANYTNRVYVTPSYTVDSNIDGKYIHVVSHTRAKTTSGSNYGNMYTSAQFVTTDKSDLRASVIQATSLDETKYTSESWRGASATVIEGFQEALREAAEVLGNPAATQGQIDSALNTLETKKAALKVIVYFDAETNGGVFTDGDKVKGYAVQFGANNTVTAGSAVLTHFSLAKYGYEFIGWTIDEDGDPTNEDPLHASLEAVEGVTFGSTLIAHYAKTISVDFYVLTNWRGDTEVIENDLTIYNNDNKALDVTVKDADDVGDYKFAGWTTDSTSTEGESIGTTLDGVTESVNYYATYIKEVTLELDAAGGTCDESELVGGIGYNYDLSQTTGTASVTLPAATKEGNSLKGWNINGTLYQAGDTVELSSSATATAEWETATYTVTFNYKNANGSDASVTVSGVEYGTSVTAPEIAAYYYDSGMHYAFANWDTSFDYIKGDTVVTATYASGAMHNYTFDGTHATCDEPGEGTYTCKLCGYSYAYKSDALDHSWSVTKSQDATCEIAGYKTYVCQHDSNHTYTEVIPATGHSYEGTTYKAATCTEDGIYYSGTCSYCNKDLTNVVIPKLGHDFTVELEHKDATCDVDGYTIYQCSRCDETYTETHKAFGHDYTSVVTAATCEEDGKVVYTCSTCGHSYSTTLPATGHSWATIVVAPSCTAKGYTEVICSDCGKSERTNYKDALGHDIVSVTVAPTCTTQGYVRHSCSVCGYTYKTDFTDELGHDYSVTTVVAPTCTNKGYTLYQCANSGCTCSYKDDYVDATGHDWVRIATVEPGVTQNGYHLYECNTCRTQYKETLYSGGKRLVHYTLYNTAGDVVPYATLTVTHVDSGETLTITTDANGYFTYVLPTGLYSVVVTKLGYDDVAGTIEVNSSLVSVDIPAFAVLNCNCMCHDDTFWGRIYRLLIKIFSIFGKRYCCDDCQVWD